MVLSAFAIELFLKCLLLLESKEIDRIHSLNVLYRRLSHKQKRRIDEVWEQEARPKLDELRRKFGLPHPTDLPNAPWPPVGGWRSINTGCAGRAKYSDCDCVCWRRISRTKQA